MHQIMSFESTYEMNDWLRDNAVKIRVKRIIVSESDKHAHYFVHYTLPDQELKE